MPSAWTKKLFLGVKRVVRGRYETSETEAVLWEEVRERGSSSEEMSSDF